MSSAVVLLLLALILVAGTPMAVLGVLLVFKGRARARRRSPLVGQLLRPPGHTLRRQIDAAQDALVMDLMLLLSAPLVVVYALLAQTVLHDLDRAWRLAPFLTAALVAFVGYWSVRLYKLSEKADALRLGYDAELAVAQELDEVVRKGAVVYHDFQADNFNIDHIVVARQGIFAIETKGRSKAGEAKGKEEAKVVFDGQTLKFPRAATQDPIGQAQRQAQWLSRWLGSATGDPVAVVPVVALPGWFVERKARGAVRVYSGGELGGLLNDRSAEPLTPDAMTRVVHQLEQRCRDVVPMSKREGQPQTA